MEHLSTSHQLLDPGLWGSPNEGVFGGDDADDGGGGSDDGVSGDIDDDGCGSAVVMTIMTEGGFVGQRLGMATWQNTRCVSPRIDAYWRTFAHIHEYMRDFCAFICIIPHFPHPHGHS